MTKLNMFRRHNKLPIMGRELFVNLNQAAGHTRHALHRAWFSVLRLWGAGKWPGSIALALSLGLGPGTVMAAGLTQEQRQIARIASQTAPWPSPASVFMSHPLGMQTLFVEKQERKNQKTPRWVNVFQYDYSRQQARLLVVDLSTQQVEQQRELQSVHLPLNDTEIDFARQLIEQNTELMQALRNDHQRRVSPAFEHLHELDVKASIHEPSDPDHPCASERCALVSLFDSSRTVFSIEPVVNLQSQNVERLSNP